MRSHLVIHAVTSVLMLACPAVAEAPRSVMPERHRALLVAHCVKCHGAGAESGVRLDDLALAIDDVGVADRWQKVLAVLNAGEMPPEDEPQPDPVAKTDFLDDLSNTLADARRLLVDQQGVIAMRRLNRREYAATIRALVGVDIDVADLPPDTGPDSFDTVGGNLFMSSNQFELYLELGRRAITQALARLGTRGQQLIRRDEPESLIAGLRKMAEQAFEPGARAERWAAAIEEVAARPENAQVVADLKLRAKNARKGVRPDAAVRLGWRKLQGAPSPETFGFGHPKGIDFVAQSAESALRNPLLPYLREYLAKPGLDRGAYLTAIEGRSSQLPLGVSDKWPAGDYVCRFRVAFAEGSSPESRYIEFCTDVAGRPAVLSVHEVTGTLDAPQVIEVPVTATPGKRFFLCHRGTHRSDRANWITFKKNYETRDILPELAIWVDWTEVEFRPLHNETLPEGLRAFAELPLGPKDPPPAAEAIRAALERFATAAFRGSPVPAGMADRLLAIYSGDLAGGQTPAQALAGTAAVILAAPAFLYLDEPLGEADSRPLAGRELAVRLSYFLWGEPPDEPLFALGMSGKLLEPATLASEVDRLLDDPRSAGFVKPFLQQWLGLDRLDFFPVDGTKFPRYDAVTSRAVRQEISRTFEHVLRENAPLNDLLRADYVIANGALARYYGLDGVVGDEFRRVPLPAGSPRGGLLGMAAVHVMGGNGDATNPVERGTWVLRKLLDDPPPPPPANIPAIGRLSGQVLTTRERLAAHQEAPQCASCHRRIDPIGFGLENFDAAGGWRTEDTYQVVINGRPDPKRKKSWTIDPAGAFHKGPAFTDFFELRDLIAARPEAFARGFTSALVEYALGRPCGFSDEPLVQSIVAAAVDDGYATRSFIHALVASKPFRTK
jgi:hypothetical protein